MYRRYLSLIFSFSLLFCLPASIFAQEQEVDNRITDTLALDIDLFAATEPASIYLKFNIREFLKNKKEDSYTEAELIYNFNDSLSIEKAIRVKARGNNRREVCTFPPLYINIKKSNLNSSSLADIEKIKFVTHCIQAKANNNNVLKEYLIYRMYNLISPYSLRVRLTRVKYIDTGRGNREYEGWGFFIEPEEMLANRVDAIPLKLDYISFNHTDPWLTDIMSMFRYIIGNADYSILTRQNIKLLRFNDKDLIYPIPVPYDFDYSGFVDADYAIPGGGNLGITSVKERYFLGPCRTEERFGEIFNYFFEKKDELYSLIESFEYLERRDKESLTDYLDEFYNQVLQKRYIKNNLLTTCRDTI